VFWVEWVGWVDDRFSSVVVVEGSSKLVSCVFQYIRSWVFGRLLHAGWLASVGLVRLAYGLMCVSGVKTAVYGRSGE
jgi:hypothetical protein